MPDKKDNRRLSESCLTCWNPNNNHERRVCGARDCSLPELKGWMSKPKQEPKAKGTGWYVAGFDLHGILEPTNEWAPNRHKVKILEFIEIQNKPTPNRIDYTLCELMSDGALQPVEEEKGTPGPWLYYLSAENRFVVKEEDGEYIAYDIDKKEDAQRIANLPQIEADLEEAVGLLGRVGTIYDLRQVNSIMEDTNKFLSRMEK